MKRKIFVLVSALIFSLLLTELLLRWVRYEYAYPDSTPWLYYRVYDPYRGYSMMPNQRLEWRSACFDVKGIEINQFGMRDRERQIQKKNLRVALLGDSFLRGFEVPNDKVINHLLEERFLGVEFLNFGESGYGTLQSYQTYLHSAVRFKPDLVVYFMYPNDLADNHYPLRALRSGIRGSEVKPGFDNYPDLVWNGRSWDFVKPADHITTAYRKHWWLSHCKIALLLKVAKDRLTSPRPAWWGSRFPSMGSTADGSDSIEMGAYEEPKDPAWSQAWEITKFCLLGLDRSVKENGAKFIVVGIPMKEEFKIKPEKAGLFYARIGHFLEDNKIPFLNLYEGYRNLQTAERVDPQSLYYDCDLHWNEAGHRETTRLAEPFIRRHLASSPAN